MKKSENNKIIITIFSVIIHIALVINFFVSISYLGLCGIIRIHLLYDLLDFQIFRLAALFVLILEFYIPIALFHYSILAIMFIFFRNKIRKTDLYFKSILYISLIVTVFSIFMNIYFLFKIGDL